MKPARLIAEKDFTMTNYSYASYRPLHRSRSTRVLGGVCGGLAGWLGWDPAVTRILYVLLSVFSAAFPGALVYVILWVVIPRGDD